MSIILENKKAIFEILIKSDTEFLRINQNIHHQGTNFEFLSEIWNLQNMPSTDSRYQTLDGDIYQHMINNDDWSYTELFVDTLKIFENDDIFILFIEIFLLPKYRKNKEDINRYVIELNNILKSDKLQLRVSDYDHRGLPLYKIKFKDDALSLPHDIKDNDIIFIVQTRTNKNTELIKQHPKHFLLRADSWDDFRNRTTFNLYFSNDSAYTVFGYIKIMTKEDEATADVLPSSFYTLPSEFCSLGQNDDFYLKLKNIFPNNYEDILFAVADCALFTDKLEEFEEHERFKKSLIRDDESEQTLRLIKFKLRDYDLETLFKFTYSFTPKYSDRKLDVAFDFNDNEIISSRIYAIIGKNGTGKTQLLSSLPISISEQLTDYFYPRVPMFSKLISVSYSIFDRFSIPRKTTKFNYVYCGLKQANGGYIDEDGLKVRFFETYKKIEEQSRTHKWRDILSNFIEEEILEKFLIPKDGVPSYKKAIYELDWGEYIEAQNKLSSGQNILLYIISEITANIRLDSLILYDEPETHLHPNAISQLINTIYELVDEFKSFCIIGTHSPLIVQEMLSKNVYVLERDGNTASIKRIGVESFGQNLTTLTEDVFGNKEIPKQYKNIIDDLISKSNSYEQILNLLEFDNMPLSLNIRLYIKSKTVNL